jgi:hypothetical protein
MPDLTAKRTLVKSPPELWEELSEVDRLAKHLGAFGEITITKLEPEHTVAWEGERASGTVSIEPSGWGTKVTLRAELPEPQEPDPEAPADDSAEAQHVDDQIRPLRVEPDAELADAEAEAERGPEPDLAPEPDPVAEPEAGAGPETPEPAPRRGFLGWLFRRRTEPVTGEPEPVGAEPEPLVAEPEPRAVAAESDPESLAAEPEALDAEPEPIASEPEPVAAEREPTAAEREPTAAEREPTAAEPEAASAAPDVEVDAVGDVDSLDPERVRLILDEALDALGAAHHRPFSRG